MLLLDVTLLLVVLSVAAWRLFGPDWRPGMRIAAVGLGLLLAVAQWLVLGFTWQGVPAWLLLALSALPPIRAHVALHWIGRSALVAIAGASIGVWALLPAVPSLPKPDGPHAVATEVYRWTDASRDEPHTDDPADRRAVIAQAWYPTAARPSGERIPYIDGLGRMPGQVSVMPAFVLNRYGQIDTHAAASPPIATRDRPWPVVIFSPGYGAPRAVYTGLASRLASRGFVVFVLDHPFESAVTELPDGQVVGLREIYPADRRQFMPHQQVVRTADIRFVIDQIGRLGVLSPRLRGRIETARVAVIGHSFGGAVSAMAMSEDPRVVAAANIDGTPYGDLPDRRLARPFMLIQSDYAETHHSELFVNGNARLLASASPGLHFEVRRANHYSFTDTPFFFATPGRWLLSRVMGGGRGPADTQQATADLVAAFLAGPLTGRPADVAAARGDRYDILVRPVAPARSD